MNIGFLTSGGLAPCLSASIGALIESYKREKVTANFVGYLNGYKGLLQSKSYLFPSEVLNNTSILFSYGGSIIGNSRIKLTNSEDCYNKGLIKKHEDPLEKAATILLKDKINILHTIGGDDTNTMASELSKFLTKRGYELTVVGLPKTVDNDIIPIVQSLGSDTAAEQSALFFKNIVNENTSSPRHLIIHEVMGRSCGWLTAASALKYQNKLSLKQFNDNLLLKKSCWDIDAIYIPEKKIDMEKEGNRLANAMDEKDCVNIFLSEGACLDEIIIELEKKGTKVNRDAFGHVRLDEINPGQWFASQFSKMIGAEKILIQKSGYFARSAAPNKYDISLIKKSAKLAVDCALNSESGVVGTDEKNDAKLSLIKFNRIKGGKLFNPKIDWFKNLLNDIGQTI